MEEREIDDPGESAARSILELIISDGNEDHRTILDALPGARSLVVVADALRRFLRMDLATSNEPRIHLLQERAILVLGDVLWRMKRIGATPTCDELRNIVADLSASMQTQEEVLRVLNEDETQDGGYLAFINQFLTAVNEQEMIDFRSARDELLHSTGAVRARDLRMLNPRVTHTARVPMRVGISSANASDNWTFSKLIGGRVVNFALDLSLAPDDRPAPPIHVTLEPLPEPVLELATYSRLDTNRKTRLVLTEDNAADFFAVPPGEKAAPQRSFMDVRDPLLLLKYALVFSGIIGFKEDPEGYCARPGRIVADVRRFHGKGGGLRLVVRGHGPSRSGFASSSCVALGLLRVLYKASGQETLAQAGMLSSMALLIENEVGLKSGKQDTDGPLYPGVKAIEYPPTSGFLASKIQRLDVDEGELVEALALVNSGIQRPPATGLKRGLNMRHYAYVSRDPERFPAVMQSLVVHHRIVEALTRSDWRQMGERFEEYLALRETIDPGATQSVFDHDAGRRVLRLPFDELKRDGLIHGGMYAGAMGGGCMMLVVTPRGRELVDGPDGRRLRRLDAALMGLREMRVAQARPFKNLEIYRYGVNARGLVSDVGVAGDA